MNVRLSSVFFQGNTVSCAIYQWLVTIKSYVEEGVMINEIL